jgi:hypothetical protein
VVSAALVAAVGCNSSSSPAALQPDAAPAEASVEAATGAPDGGDAGGDAAGISLTWATVLSATGSTATDGGDAGDGGAATDGGSENAAAGNNGDGGPPGVPGVQVCLYPMDAAIPSPSASTSNDCVMSAADGTFFFPSVPVRTNLAVTLTKTGFLPVLLSIQTASAAMDARTNPVDMFPSNGQQDPIPGITIDWQNKGQIFLFVIGPAPDGGLNFAGDPGVIVSMSPTSGNGPYYQDTNANFVPSATAFIENLAAYFNVAGGTYTLTFDDSATKTDCEPIAGALAPAALWGFPVPTPPHTLQVLVAPGYVSGLVGALCTPVSVLVSTDGG